jgi:hypothetical protein
MEQKMTEDYTMAAGRESCQSQYRVREANFVAGNGLPGSRLQVVSFSPAGQLDQYC